jgi:hypothetical protein
VPEVQILKVQYCWPSKTKLLGSEANPPSGQSLLGGVMSESLIVLQHEPRALHEFCGKTCAGTFGLTEDTTCKSIRREKVVTPLS